MSLDWNKKQMQEYISNIQKKKKQSKYDEAIIDFYMAYLKGHYCLDYQTKEEFKNEIKKRMKKKTLDEIKSFCDDSCQFVAGVLPKKFYFSLMNLINYLGPLCLIEEESYSIEQKKMTDQDLIDQSYLVFQDLSPIFTEYLDYIFSKKLVKMRKKSDVFNEDSFCYPDLTNNVGFVYVDPFDKFSTTESVFNHELTHAITCMTNHKFFTNDKFGLLSEVHSIYVDRYTNNCKADDLRNLKANYNYLLYLRELVASFKICSSISNMSKISKASITDKLYQDLGMKIFDFDLFMSVFLENDLYDNLTYLVSGLLALHLLDQEKDKSKVLFTNTLFNKDSAFTKFLNSIEYNLKDQYYGCDLFNRVCVNDKNVLKRRR